MIDRPNLPVCLLAGLLFAATGLRAQQSARTQPSPFLPATGATATNKPNDTLELTGISVLGDKTYVGLFDTQTKSSRWMAVGATENGISVVSCDPAKDQVVVRAGGEEKVLVLRHAAVAAGSNSVAFVNPAPAAATVTSGVNPSAELPPPVYAKPGTVAHEEQEARMLVSDLLEIGMQQRKAYEEAQKKAAEAKK